MPPRVLEGGLQPRRDVSRLRSRHYAEPRRTRRTKRRHARLTAMLACMPMKRRAAAAVIAALLSTNGDCTPLIVGRSGHHIFIATNSIDTDGKSRCKLHFAKSAVIMWATQAASMTLK